MGISDSEFTGPTQNGRVHYYLAAGGVDPETDVAPPASALWSDAGTLGKYDVVMLPCEGSEIKKPAGGLQNIVDYTSQGGRRLRHALQLRVDRARAGAVPLHRRLAAGSRSRSTRRRIRSRWTWISPSPRASPSPSGW